MAEQSERKPGPGATLGRGWRNIRAAGGRRIAGTLVLLVLAFCLARLSWWVPIISDAEHTFYDMRAYVNAPRVEQDQRIQVIVYDDQTLIAARKRSPLDRGLLARALRNIDAMGAKAIGIDMLFDQPQDEDDELIATLRSMKTPSFIGYARNATNPDDIKFEQQQFLDEFVARLDGSQAKAASVRLDETNGATRDWPAILPREPEVMSRAMLRVAEPEQAARFDGFRGAIRYRRQAFEDQPVFSELRIDLFADPALAQALAEQVRGRFVLIGGDIVDTDRVNTTFTSVDGERPAGILVHAAMLAQMLDGAPAKQLGPIALALLALAVVLAAAMTSLLDWRLWKVLPFALLQLGLFGGLPFLLQGKGYDTQFVPAVGWGLGWIIAFAAVASAARVVGAEQRRFAQSALGKYLPRDIAQQIIEKPELLALHGRKHELFILFSDLEGFTQLSHSLEPEVVARLLNEYLETLSQVVLDHGGVIDKFVGDAVVAFWGAPIPRPDDGLKAAEAGYAMWQAGEAFRKRQGPEIPPIGKTRVGLHFGDAVVGNFGGERRIQYTALGDAMNTAARLESANKSLHSSVIASREFVDRSGVDWWRPMGKVVLRGRKKPVEIFEPAPDFPFADLKDLERALALGSDNHERAVEMVGEIAARHPADEALQNLLMRLSSSTKGEAYVLG